MWGCRKRGLRLTIVRHVNDISVPSWRPRRKNLGISAGVDEISAAPNPDVVNPTAIEQKSYILLES